MNLKYLSVEDATKRVGKDEFLRNVRSAVIPRLIQKGLLQGKKEKKSQLVADDDSLARLAGLGVETFVQNQQGYSFMVVRAPIEDVAAISTNSVAQGCLEAIEVLEMCGDQMA